jgi:DNA-binding IscR family transcriptional regulator
MAADYREVVTKMMAYLQMQTRRRPSTKYRDVSAEHLAKLEELVQAELVESVVDQGGGKALLKDLLK